MKTITTKPVASSQIAGRVPLVIDLCCGLGGWAEGFIAEGWDCHGYDITAHRDKDGKGYPGHFHLVDVLNLSGIDLPLADLIVASPPCQEFSRHDQPWTRVKNPPLPDASIWRACERIAKEACLPIIIENVRGAQKFMGKANWHCGAYYLWRDTPAIWPCFPKTTKGFTWFGSKGRTGKASGIYRTNQSRSSSAVAERSKVPIELATYIARTFAPVGA